MKKKKRFAGLTLCYVALCLVALSVIVLAAPPETCPAPPADPSVCPDGSAPICPEHAIDISKELDVSFTADVDFDTVRARGTISADSGTMFIEYLNRPNSDFRDDEVLNYERDCMAQLDPLKTVFSRYVGKSNLENGDVFEHEPTVHYGRCDGGASLIVPSCAWLATPGLPTGVDNLPFDYVIDCDDILRPIVGSKVDEGSTCLEPGYWAFRSGLRVSQEYAERYTDQGVPGPLLGAYCAGWECIPDVEQIIDTHPDMSDDVREIFEAKKCENGLACEHGFCIDPLEVACPNHYAPCYCALKEQKCEIRDVEILFAPHQKVWVNEPQYGKNYYTRVTDTINSVGFPMVVDRSTELKGVYKESEKDRDAIIIRGKSTFPDSKRESVEFEVKQGSNIQKITGASAELPFQQLSDALGNKNPCLTTARDWEIRITHQLNPAKFTFKQTGDYEIGAYTTVNGERTLLGKVIGQTQKVTGWDRILVTPLQLIDQSEEQDRNSLQSAINVWKRIREDIHIQFPYPDNAKPISTRTVGYDLRYLDDDFPDLAQKIGQEVLRSNRIRRHLAYDRIILLVPSWHLFRTDFTDEFGERLMLALNRKVVMVAPRGDFESAYDSMKMLLETTGPSYKDWRWSPIDATNECGYALAADRGEFETDANSVITKQRLAPILGISRQLSPFREISQCSWVHMLNYWKSKQDPEVLLVGGTIHEDGSDGSLLPLYRRDGFIDLNESDGDWQIVLLDENDNELGRYGFSEVFEIADVPLEQMDFNYFVPWHEGTVRVDLEGPQGLVATRTLSQHSPVVELDIEDGATLESRDNRVSLRWTADDPDGDDLVYSVIYAADFGEEQVMRLELTETAYDLAIDPNATSHTVIILANDGANEAESVRTFSVTAVEPAAPVLLWIAILALLIIAGGVAYYFIRRARKTQ